MNLASWKAFGLRTGDMLELGLRSLNVSVACQFCALLSYFLTTEHQQIEFSSEILESSRQALKESKLGLGLVSTEKGPQTEK